jgi:hypothetical protein
VRASTAISQKNRIPIPVNRPQQARKGVRWAGFPHHASNRFVQSAFLIGVAMRKALSIVPTVVEM